MPYYEGRPTRVKTNLPQRLGSPRVAGGPFVDDRHGGMGLQGEPIGETMVERFDRERGFAPKKAAFGLPPESDQFSYPLVQRFEMPTATPRPDMGQYVPGLRSYELQRHEHLRQAAPDGYPPASAIDPSNEYPVSALDIANPHVKFGSQPIRGSLVSPQNHSATGQGSVGAIVPRQPFGMPPEPSYQRPQFMQRPFGQPIDLTRPPEQQDLQHQFVTQERGPSDYKFMLDKFDAMSDSRDALVRRNLEQAGGVRPKGRYDQIEPSLYQRGLTPQQAAYVDNDLRQGEMANTRFVGGMGEKPRDLSGDRGVRFGQIRPGVPLAYIPQYQSNGWIGQSRFVEGTERNGMTIDRNPLTGGIRLTGGGRPIRDESVRGQEEGEYASRQELYARRQARDQSYKDLRAQRAYGRNPRLANAQAVADMRDRKGDVEYARTLQRKRDAMLDQVQMAALQQQLKGMTPQQLEEFLGAMQNRPRSSRMPSAKEAKKYRDDKRIEQFNRANDGSGYGFGSY